MASTVAHDTLQSVHLAAHNIEALFGPVWQREGKEAWNALPPSTWRSYESLKHMLTRVDESAPSTRSRKRKKPKGDSPHKRRKGKAIDGEELTGSLDSVAVGRNEHSSNPSIPGPLPPPKFDNAAFYKLMLACMLLYYGQDQGFAQRLEASLRFSPPPFPRGAHSSDQKQQDEEEDVGEPNVDVAHDPLYPDESLSEYSE
jgi:hypothetical protein